MITPPPTAPATVYPRECGGTFLADLNDGGVTGLSPRVRGTVPTHLELHGQGGLSPRVRGNQSQPLAPLHSVRSIPASAGEPPCACLSVKRHRVYPRECGGTTTGPRLITRAHGLSPRVRGNRLPRSGHGQISRSIPASAGEPAIIRSAAGRQRVYPRECGGTPIPAHPSRPQTGLSPRVRGNRPSTTVNGSVQGSIPASAGEP